MLLSHQPVSVRATRDAGEKFIGLRQAFFDFGSRSESTISCIEISVCNYRFVRFKVSTAVTMMIIISQKMITINYRFVSAVM
jgi:hypothetical protein